MTKGLWKRERCSRLVGNGRKQGMTPWWVSWVFYLSPIHPWPGCQKCLRSGTTNRHKQKNPRKACSLLSKDQEREAQQRPRGELQPIVPPRPVGSPVCWQQWQQNPRPSGTGRQSDMNTASGAIKPVCPCPLPSGTRRPKPSGFCSAPSL